MSRNNKQIFIYPLSLSNFKKWKFELKKTCILSNYHNHYENLRMIKHKNTSKVILAMNKVEKKEYAVKIYEKNSLDEKLKVGFLIKFY